jgi:hypothetical protein
MSYQKHTPYPTQQQQSTVKGSWDSSYALVYNHSVRGSRRGRGGSFQLGSSRPRSNSTGPSGHISSNPRGVVGVRPNIPNRLYPKPSSAVVVPTFQQSSSVPIKKPLPIVKPLVDKKPAVVVNALTTENTAEEEQQQHICQLHSDTLDQCFDKAGVYTCKSYGPRCYIIQKVRKAHAQQLTR